MALACAYLCSSVCKGPFTGYNLFSNRFDNRVNVCIHDTTGCQTGLTTGCIVYTAGCQSGCTTRLQGRNQEFYFGGGLKPMASAEIEAITGVWGQSPQRGPGAEPLVRGFASPEAESFFVDVRP